MAKKKGTPEGIDELLAQRDEISEDDYEDYWDRLNKARKEGREEFEAEAREILKELREAKNYFRASDFGSISEARRAAEIRQSDIGGRIVRRAASGKFSARGSIFQVIGGEE